jgi:hypothetical protein
MPSAVMNKLKVSGRKFPGDANELLRNTGSGVRPAEGSVVLLRWERYRPFGESVVRRVGIR